MKKSGYIIIDQGNGIHAFGESMEEAQEDFESYYKANVVSWNLDEEKNLLEEVLGKGTSLKMVSCTIEFNSR